MKCAYSNETLALYVENDLPDSQAEAVERHLTDCPRCQDFCQQLRESQSMVKSLRQVPVSSAALAGVRNQVLSRIDGANEKLEWGVRIERWILLGFRRQRYAFAGLVAGLGILAIVSASLLGQMRHAAPAAVIVQGAVFEGKDTLLRPEGYREWIFVGSSRGLGYANNPAPARPSGPGVGSEMFHNVYINPAAYREFAGSGEFPEGTVMVLEMASSETRNEPGLQGSFEKEFIALEASVKDSSRFDGGWGYFGFTDREGKLMAKAQAFPDGSGCRSCHEERAETDHVFTQFYPVLRAAGTKS